MAQSTMSGDFLNKVVVITGASSGLGQATAILFAQKGASIVLCGRDEERLKDTLGFCVEASGGHSKRFIKVQGDITESSSRQKIIEQTIQTFQQLDVLVANAGVLMPESGLENATEASFDIMFDTNVKAVYFLIQAALPHLEKSNGNVVSVSSNASTMVSARSIYPMTKAAVDHMTRCLAFDLAPKGIRVNSVNPSYVVTRMRRHYDNYEEVARQVEERESPKHPLNGKCITPDDVANAIAFLASDAAKCITGQCQHVDNGRNFVGSSCSYWSESKMK